MPLCVCVLRAELLLLRSQNILIISCVFVYGREAAACGMSPCAGESPWRYSEKHVLADVVYSDRHGVGGWWSTMAQYSAGAVSGRHGVSSSAA